MDDDTLRQACAQLKRGGDHLPWPERRALARNLGEAMAHGTPQRMMLALLRLLAQDAKWEVRREVAQALLTLPPAEYENLAFQLAQDTNQFVRQAAGRAIDRRRACAKQDFLARESLDEISQRLEQLATQHGRRVAREARRICDRFGELVVGSMVHDLRTIQTYFIGHCHALIAEGHKRRKAAVHVAQDLDFLHRTIADMEIYTRPIPSERRPERVTELLAAARDLAEENVRKAGGDPTQVTLRIEVSDQLVVEVARHLMVMALANILKNALEACLALGCDRAGQIQVTAAQQEGAVEIRIADNGIGMSHEEKIGWSEFIPGRRNKSKRLSTGYGLPIAVRNLAAHGGTLTLESTEDVETIVTIRIPVDSDE